MYSTVFLQKTGLISANTCTLFLILLQPEVNYKPIFLSGNLMQPLSHARIHFNQQGTPVATDFDDIYFSNEGGLAETDYVFLQQNQLPARWPAHQRAFFHVLETGFGTGANFLVCWQHFRRYLAAHPTSQCQRLYFSSFEKFPLSQADLAQALSCHAHLQEQCEQLLAAYPPAISGCHRLVFEQGKVILDLWLGDVNELLPQLPAQNAADAIFLDGFAPAKNPDMWQSTLFNQLYRLSQPGTTLATFTCAGLVKRGLSDAGFTIKKVKGFGRKREMLTANRLETTEITKVATPATKVTIIGGGIAALTTAFALTQRGVPVELLCADNEVAQGASHNRQGALYPNLPVGPTPTALLHCQAFSYSRQFYALCQRAGITFPMDFCGLLHLATTTQLAQRQQKMAEQQRWPTALLRFVDPNEASALAGVELTHSGIFLPDAGWLAPQQLCQALLQYLQQNSTFQVHFNCQVNDIEATASGWLVNTSQTSYTATQLIMATGAELARFAPLASIPLNRIRGQVSHVQSAELASLNTVICHKGYLTPAWQGLHCIGATFDREANNEEVTEQDNQQNVTELQQQLGPTSWTQSLQVVSAKAALRATVLDHLPLCGEMLPASKLWVHGGLGARGLLFAPLLAEILACQLSAEPLPCSVNTLQMLAPDRFTPLNTSRS